MQFGVIAVDTQVANNTVYQYNILSNLPTRDKNFVCQNILKLSLHFTVFTYYDIPTYFVIKKYDEEK